MSPLAHRVMLYLAQYQHVGREELAFVTGAPECKCESAADSLVLAGLARRVALPDRVDQGDGRPFWGILPSGEAWLWDEG